MTREVKLLEQKLDYCLFEPLRSKEWKLYTQTMVLLLVWQTILEFMEMSAHLTKFNEHSIIQLLQKNVQNFVVYIVILNIILNKVNFSK